MQRSFKRPRDSLRPKCSKALTNNNVYASNWRSVSTGHHLMSVYGGSVNFLKLNILGLALVLTSSLSFADSEQNSVVAHPGEIHGDIEIREAVSSRQNQFYVEGAELVVTNILPDDTNGLPHQKWEARLSDGRIIMVVYNSNMGDRIPVEIGATFSVGGQFIWTPDGGLVHWVHADPKHKRPDGYVMFDGVVYGGAKESLQPEENITQQASGF